MVSVELGFREGSDVVPHLLPGCYGELYQPLDHRVDVDEVETLDLMGLQTMRTLHPGEDSHNLFRQGTE